MKLYRFVIYLILGLIVSFSTIETTSAGSCKDFIYWIARGFTKSPLIEETPHERQANDSKTLSYAPVDENDLSPKTRERIIKLLIGLSVFSVISPYPGYDSVFTKKHLPLIAYPLFPEEDAKFLAEHRKYWPGRPETHLVFPAVVELSSHDQPITWDEIEKRSIQLDKDESRKQTKESAEFLRKFQEFKKSPAMKIWRQKVSKIIPEMKTIKDSSGKDLTDFYLPGNIFDDLIQEKKGNTKANIIPASSIENLKFDRNEVGPWYFSLYTNLPLGSKERALFLNKYSVEIFRDLSHLESVSEPMKKALYEFLEPENFSNTLALGLSRMIESVKILARLKDPRSIPAIKKLLGLKISDQAQIDDAIKLVLVGELREMNDPAADRIIAEAVFNKVFPKHNAWIIYHRWTEFPKNASRAEVERNARMKLIFEDEAKKRGLDLEKNISDYAKAWGQ